ncbi:MAG: hypothetical protein WC639_05035 [Patescibacteria group bacterium]|jgi:hypothetical protein
MEINNFDNLKEKMHCPKNVITENLRICVVPSKEMAKLYVKESSDKDRIGSSIEFPATYKVFLINDGSRDIKNINFSVSGFDGSGDELEYMDKREKSIRTMKTGKALLIEELDYGLLDYAMDYTLKIYWMDGTHSKVCFEIFKSYGLKEETMSFEPILNSSAYHLELKDCAGSSK